MQTFREFVQLQEVGNQPYSFELYEDDDTLVMYRFKTSDGKAVSVTYEPIDYETDTHSEWWELEFGKSVEKNSETMNYKKTGEGDAFKIFATVIATMKDFQKLGKPSGNQITIFAARTSGPNANSRIDLYRAMLKRYGCKFKEEDMGPQGVRFFITGVKNANI